MKRFLLILTMIFILSSIALYAQDGNNKTSRYNTRENNYTSFREQLNLSEQQINTMDNLRTNHQKDMITMNANLKTKEIEKQQALKNDDYKKAKSLNKDIAKIKQDIADKRVDMQKAMKDVLTEEQKTLIKDNPHYMRGFGSGYGMHRDSNFGNRNFNRCGSGQRRPNKRPLNNSY